MRVLSEMSSLMPFIAVFEVSMISYSWIVLNLRSKIISAILPKMLAFSNEPIRSTPETKRSCDAPTGRISFPIKRITLWYSDVVY